MSTSFQTKEDAIKDRKWLIVDAADQSVGRVASVVASLLRGKHKPSYTTHVDDGDFVIVLNAEKVKFTGKKRDQKVYYSHSTYPGGLKAVTAKQLMEDSPEQVMVKAVKGMLPKGALGYQLETKLRVYVGEEHPHDAQQPEKYELGKAA